MTELQRIEFDMLKIFVGICDKLSLNYYLVCGSALGAVKYKGFIPWDDDVDIGLLRPDYEIFIREADKYLPDYLFLQNYHTDKAFSQIFSKLRNCNTTYIEKSCARLDINHGIYIDIFPLDGYPDNDGDIYELEAEKARFLKNMSCVYDMPCLTFKSKCAKRLRRILGKHRNTDKRIAKFEKIICAPDVNASKFICNHGNWQGKLEYAPKEQYGSGVWAEFEGLKVRIPERYDEYLTQKYGDWRADLPEDQRAGHHYFAVCDVNLPYTDYTKKLSGGKIRIKNRA